VGNGLGDIRPDARGNAIDHAYSEAMAPTIDRRPAVNPKECLEL
jgi:hypothetical protein